MGDFSAAREIPDYSVSRKLVVRAEHDGQLVLHSSVLETGVTIDRDLGYNEAPGALWVFDPSPGDEEQVA
jgi:hypothetical protein